jgi:conjugal transfer pilus assembly protein TraF
MFLAATACVSVPGLAATSRSDSGFDAAAKAFYGVSDRRFPSEVNTPSHGFFDDKERGWFWYEEDDELGENEEEARVDRRPPLDHLQETKILPQPEVAPPPASKPLSAEWFRKNLEKFRDQAIDEPTPEHVSTYLYLQRVMLDKAEQFTEVTQQVMMADAVLDENSRRPIASFGGYAMDDKASRGTDKVAKQLADSMGLWFFYDSTCEFCVKQAGVLKGLMTTYGFKVLAIAIDGLPLPDGSFPHFILDRGQAKQLGVDTTPALFLVKPGDDGGVIQLGQGLLAADELIKRAISLGYHQHWLTDHAYAETKKVKPVQIDTKTIQAVDDALLAEPAQLVKNLRAHLRRQLADHDR